MGRDFAKALLSGRRVRQHQLPRCERERLSAYAYARARRPLFTNPLYLALALGYRLHPVTMSRPAPATLSEATLYYNWSGDPLDVGLSVYRCLAAALLREGGHSPAEIEAELLAAELALPERLARGLSVENAVAAQPNVPRWWIEARLMGFRPTGVRSVAV